MPDYIRFYRNKYGIPVYILNGNPYVSYSSTFSNLNTGKLANVSDLPALRSASKWYSKTNGQPFKQMSDDVYSRIGTDRLYGKISRNGKDYYLSNLGATDAKWNKENGIWEREGYTYTPYKMTNGLNSYKWVKNVPDKSITNSNLPEVTVTGKNLSNLPYITFRNNKLSSLLSRKDWVNQNVNYLKSKGWTDAEINGYSGQANLNLRLAKDLEGFDAWKKLKNNRKDIYSQADVQAPFAQVNPIVAAKKVGGQINYQKIFK